MASPTTPRARLLVLGVVCAAQFVAVVDDTIVNTALPSIRGDLGFSERDLSWVVNAYLLTFGGFLLLGGRAADVLGRRRIFLAGVALFALCSAACGIAQSSGMLVGSRGLQGLSSALLSPAALSILLVTFPAGPERTKALGVWASLLALGAATGLVGGGALTQALDWRWVFFINVPICLAILVLAPRLLPTDPPRDRRARVDLPGAVLVTAATLALVFTVVEAPEQGWGSLNTIAGLAAAAVLLAGFARHVRTAAQPLIAPALLQRRVVSTSNLIMLLAAGALYAMFFFLTLYMQLVLGWSPLRAGVSALGFSVAFALTSGVTTKLIDKVPVRALLSAGAAIGAGGLLLMSTLDGGSSYVTGLLPAQVIAGIGMGLSFVPLTAVATGAAGSHEAGVVSGLLTTCQQVGGALGIAVLVSIASRHTEGLAAAGSAPAEALTGGLQTAFVVDAAIMLAAALAVALLGRVRALGSPLPA